MYTCAVLTIMYLFSGKHFVNKNKLYYRILCPVLFALTTIEVFLSDNITKSSHLIALNDD